MILYLRGLLFVLPKIGSYAKYLCEKSSGLSCNSPVVLAPSTVETSEHRRVIVLYVGRRGFAIR